ncbi:MAG: patatin-like phospholipase family protein [Mucilaginibacter sp.]|uniref:patatin-like phospholipase family protein n=1 Tax=Mucilaginibacter sp. TaxID=1882438 RepID=UPI0031B1A98E
MEQTTPQSDVFSVGICMAGAVSAGAYTAGVMDYLLEALQEWEKRRGQPGVPSHRVEIPVIGGASAGGMTGIIVASSLNSPITPIDKPSADLLEEHPENKFYNAWVDLTDADMFSTMLDTSDIEKTGTVLSGLNSDFIDQVANKMVKAIKSDWQPLPRFINPNLKVFTTLSNLGGFNYSADFYAASPTNRKYHMMVHNDYACFELTEKTDLVAPNNGWIPLNFKDDIHLDIARDAAMATGAFPVGLKSRLLNRDAGFINSSQFLTEIFKNTPLTPSGNYTSLNVDGGLINNEPFDKVREVLASFTGESQQASDDHNGFNSTILMIEPFPSKERGPIDQSQSILNVIGLTLSSMLSQMRSKPTDLANALNDNLSGQYLISPARLITDANGITEEIVGELAIACGALNGFSGFINKEFRVHDYFLGRYNCKIFLRDYFTIPKSAIQENRIFRNGYAETNIDDFKSTKDDERYQIIPIFKDATNYEFPSFKFSSGSNWPVLKEEDIDKFQPAIKKRAQALLMNAVKLGGMNKALLWIGTKVLLSGSMTNAALTKIKSDLKLWKLLD